MRQYEVAVGAKTQFDGPFWAVRCILADASGFATLSLDDSVPLPLYGAYTIPAPSPNRPFRKVIVTGRAIIQLAEGPEEDLSGGVLVAQGGSRRTLVTTEVILAANAYQSAKLRPDPERGIVLQVENDATVGGRSFIVQGYTDDGVTLIWESGNAVAVVANARQRLLYFERATAQQVAITTPTSAAGIYDGVNTGVGSADAGMALPLFQVMGLRAAAGSGTRIRTWL